MDHVRSILTAWSMQLIQNEKKKIMGPKAIAIPNHESSWWKWSTTLAPTAAHASEKPTQTRACTAFHPSIPKRKPIL
jgi:hypothetical protein